MRVLNSQFYEALSIRPNILGRVLYKPTFSGFHEPLEKSVKQNHSEYKSDYNTSTKLDHCLS